MTMQAKNPFRGVKIFFIAYFALLVLSLTFVGVMGWLGYAMIDISIEYALLGLLICSALIAAAVFACRRLMHSWAKIITGTALSLLAAAAAAVLLALYSMSLFSAKPVHYTTLTSPGGRDVVVLRSLSTDSERADARRAERLAANPASPADEYVLGDLGYVYTAHPRCMHFFYNKKVAAEGVLEIGCASAAELKYDWQDADALHMYIENPENGDSGELSLVLG